MWVTSQPNVALALWSPALAVTVTEYGDPLEESGAGAPVIVPLSASMDRPGGRPLALYCSSSSLALMTPMASSTVSPSSVSWWPGLRTTSWGTVQSKLPLALWEPSETVTVTLYGAAAAADAATVPEIRPMPPLMLIPPGRPLAL